MTMRLNNDMTQVWISAPVDFPDSEHLELADFGSSDRGARQSTRFVGCLRGGQMAVKDRRCA